MKIKKVAHIRYTDDYGGLRAWMIQKSYDGVIEDRGSHMVMKREHFNSLQDYIEECLEEGYEVEIGS
jgi:hypothetical protein